MSETPADHGMDLDARQELEAVLLARRRARKRQRQVSALPRDAPLPLSTAQKSLWFAHLVAPDPSVQNIIQAQQLSGPVDDDYLRQAFNDLVERQEVLRLRIKTKDGLPCWVTADPRPVLRVHDCSGIPPNARDAEMQRLVNTLSCKPFDLAAEPPVRADFFRFSENEGLLVIVVHHISCDEWSMRILRSDFAAFYRARRSGSAAALPDLPVQYADLAAVQDAADTAEENLATLDRWARRLEGSRTDDRLPAAHPAPGTTGADGIVSLRLPDDLTTGLDEMGRAAETTPFMTMLATALCFMHLQTGHRDITIATLVAGRTGPDAANLVGLFTNTVIVRSQVTKLADFHRILQSVRAQVLDAVTHQSIRYESLLKQMRVARNHETAAYAQTMFTHRKSFETLELAGDVRSEPMASNARRAKHDVWLSVIDDDAGRMIRFIFDGKRHDRAQMQWLMTAYETTLRRLLQSSEIILPEHAEKPSNTAPGNEIAVEEPGFPAPTADDRTLNEVTRLWRNVLGGINSDPDASFFEEGGDLLLLMRLLHLIEVSLGVALPLSDAFEAPTIRTLAGRVCVLSQDAVSVAYSDQLIEPLLTNGSSHGKRPRYFLVAGGGGHVAPFSGVARWIDARWEGLGILDPMIFDEEEPQHSIEALAARMVKAVRSVDPVGPWLLAGYSAGGRTVYEIARQLRESGGSAGCVVLDAGVSERTLRNRTLLVLRQIKRGGRVGYRQISDRIMALRIRDEMATEMQRRRYRRISDLQHGRLLNYFPTRSDTPVALVRATDNARGRRRHDYGWSAHARLVAVADTPGDHWTCFRREHEQHFAAALEEALNKVRDVIRAETLTKGDPEQ